MHIQKKFMLMLCLSVFLSACDSNNKHEQEQKKDEPLVIVEPAEEIEGEDINSQLTPLIKSGKTNKEICKNLQISSDTLYRELLDLKNKGLIAINPLF